MVYPGSATTGHRPAGARSGRPLLAGLLPVLLIVVLACYGPSLETYTPANPDEAAIVSLLIQYQEAKVACDLEQYLDCLHEEGRYHFGRGIMATKAQLAEDLPGFWAGLKSGKRHFYPMNREMITGNYVRTGRLVGPEIDIRNGTAKVTVSFTKRGWRLRHYITLVKEKGRWWITRLDWETN